MKIGLLGAGTIGYGVVELTDAHDDLRIVRVLDRLEIPGLEGRLTKDVNDILSDKSIDTVIELLGGVEPAKSWVISAMNAGKNVVTANKLMVSENLSELVCAAKKNGVQLRFSPAVGGGIPYIVNLLRARRYDDIAEVGGILNGTTNYVLDMMQSEGVSFEKSIELAQAAGYAERKVDADVSGSDAQSKITLAASIAYNGIADKSMILTEGIAGLTYSDINAVNALNYTLKLFAVSKKVGGRVCAYVEPTLVRPETVEANIRKVENMAYFISANAGLQRFTGAGAGRYPTAYAVINDLIDIRDNPSASQFDVDSKAISIDNTIEKHRYVVKGVYVEDADIIADGYSITPEISVHDMHRLAKTARDNGANVFFAGIRE